MNDVSAWLVLLAAGAPWAVGSLLVVRPWRHVVCRAAPVAAVPALVLALLGPVGAKASLPWLVQHTVLELDAVGRVFLGFTSALWLLPGTLEVLPRKLSPEKLWDALWPLLLGGTLAGLGAWLRRWFSRDASRWLPAGDLGVLLERRLARWQRGARIEGHSHPEPESDRGESSAQEAPRWSLRLRRAGESIVRLEEHLRSWPVAGALWLLLMVLLIGLLAASNP
ncbi:MAG TPA: hypothetical protein PKM73_20510 [Verrucomicrobiota bacterium]|nr:hypothetical protein [Verrucomicrobiota bacterium]HNU52216.1 hypothetical protein [Verrucomicrobiota bacterium]